MTHQLLTELGEFLQAHNQLPIVLTDANLNQIGQQNYDKYRKVFNRKFEFRPLAIVFVENTEQVALIVKFASKHDLPFTVRSGGHDHEGECVATGKLLIDFAKMNHVQVVENNGLQRVNIKPGARFERIKPILDNHHLAVAHGTCQSVAIAGYTMGGGWGPWTRKYGMGCERLIGATLVLGDGSIEHLSVDQDNNSPQGQLLFALRGGGGLSYGIVTEMVFDPFPLPDIAFSFVIKKSSWALFADIVAIDVLAAWEQATAQDSNPQLIGTNLKMDAIGLDPDGGVANPMAKLNWQFNGHFGGSEDQLFDMLERWCAYLQPHNNRLTTANIKSWLKKHLSNSANLVKYDKQKLAEYYRSFERWDRQIKNNDKNGLSLEVDLPAPHKLTSRLAEQRWNEDSRKALVCSMQSTHLFEVADKSNVSAYFTLGAISGSFYRDNPNGGINGSAFPYKDCLFTIQYQAWWDEPAMDKQGNIVPPSQVNETRFFENKAQDWIESVRDYDIKHTRGAFISFKDASIPTSQYFGDNYQCLQDIKINHSQDSKCLLRSRKTII